MVVTTVNIPKKYLDYIKVLVGKEFYPSRSELVRVALRDLLIRDINIRNQMIDDIREFNEKQEDQVKIPISENNVKIYNIVRRLE